MRRSAATSQAGRFTSRSFPSTRTLRTLSKLRLFSHAPVCDEVRTVAPLVAAPPAVYSPTNHPGPICVFFTPAPSLASGIRPWAECVQRQPITNGPRHGWPGTGQHLKGGGYARQRGPSPLTAGPPGLTTHPHSQGPSSFAGGGPSSLPASGRRPKATQHKRRTDR